MEHRRQQRGRPRRAQAKVEQHEGHKYQPKLAARAGN